jgi:hypothetical protein
MEVLHMFWIGMIVGIVLTIAAIILMYHLSVLSWYGSHEDYIRAWDVMQAANEHRTSRIVAYTDYGAVLDSYELRERN